MRLRKQDFSQRINANLKIELATQDLSHPTFAGSVLPLAFKLVHGIAPVLKLYLGMKKSKQYAFFKSQPKFYPKFFGGALLEGKRKSFRPLSSKDAIHFVLRSEWALGKDSFLVLRNKKPLRVLYNDLLKNLGLGFTNKQ